MKIDGTDASDVWMHENAFYWYSAPSRLDKALAQYEIYKRIIDLPGDVLELGVYKAASLIRLATFRRLLETETSRKVVGFDAFGRFPRGGGTPSDEEFISDFELQSGDGLSLEDTAAVIDLKGFRNVELVKGDILQTLPRWMARHPETRIALLHIDTDVYSPARHALELCWDRIVPGGVVMLDDYGAVEGETRAVDEFVDQHQLRISKLPYYRIPSFIVKESKSAYGRET